MTINFICGVIAELFESPCNFSPIDEYMLQDNFCESHCGEVADKDCWKRYFEKRWGDSKMSEIPNSSEKPNNCEACGTPKHLCQYCIEEDRMWTPKTDPQTDPCDGCVCDDGKHLMYCMNCKGIAWKTDPPKVEDEPQTDCKGENCVWWSWSKKYCARMLRDMPCEYKPRYFKDKPQTDCAWGKEKSDDTNANSYSDK